jgi:hypothetical protein
MGAPSFLIKIRRAPLRSTLKSQELFGDGSRQVGLCLRMERGGDFDCCFCLSHGGVDATLDRGL